MVLLKPGVMDPVAQSAELAAAILVLRSTPSGLCGSTGSIRLRCSAVASHLQSHPGQRRHRTDWSLAPCPSTTCILGSEYQFELKHTPIADLDDDGLMRLSREGQLYLQLAEMQTIQKAFRRHWAASQPTSSWKRWPKPGANIAATRRWPGGSPIATSRGNGNSRTCSRRPSLPPPLELRERWGDDDWCVSVFQDNAGIVRFDDQHNFAFKVETHNHPSALGTLWWSQHRYWRGHPRHHRHRHGGQADL